MKLAYPKLGCSELRISPVVLGAMSLPTEEGVWKRSERMVLAALDRGITTIDTAPLYAFGRNETLVGSAIHGRRADVVLLTKVGLRWDDDPVARRGCAPRGRVHFSEYDARGQRRTVRRDCRPESVRMEVEASLRRLGTEIIDLVQVHFRDVETPVAETIGALLDLRCAGKLRAIGVSNFSVGEVSMAHATLGEVGLASHQIEYNLVDRDMGGFVAPHAARLGVGVLAYSPLRRGLLAGRMEKGAGIEGARTRGAVSRALITLKEIAETRGDSPAVVALAWLLQQRSVSAVIAGASSVEQILDNAGAMEAVLSDDDAAHVGRAFARCDGVLDLSLAMRGRGLIRRWRRRLLG
ncbi:MAG: aldo/keto reductase [Nannocystaceae bacterium]